MKNLIIGIIIGIIFSATIAYAYQYTVLVNNQGTEWGSTSNPVYINIQ